SALLMALPFIGFGLKAGMGTRRAAIQITSNLLATGMEPKAIPALARWTTLAAKIGPRAALSRAPASIRGTRLFAIVNKNLRSEAGGLRISERSVRLSEPAERMILLADTGKKIKRAELIRAAKGEKIGGVGNRLIRMSNEAIIFEMKAKRRGFERLLGIKNALKARPKMTRGLRRTLEKVLIKGPKASLKELRNAARRAGVEIGALGKKPAQLTTEESIELGKLRAIKNTARMTTEQIERFDELETVASRIAAGAPDEKAILLDEITDALRPRGVEVAATERAITVAPQRVPGVVPGRLADVPDVTVQRIFKDIIQGNSSRDDHLNLRRIIEEEINRSGRTADDLYDSGDYLYLGRSPITDASGDISRTIADEQRFVEAGGIREFEEGTRALRFSDDPVIRSRAIADETANYGRGGGSGRPPVTEVTTPPLPDPSPGTERLPLLKSMKEFAIDQEHSTSNAMAGIARIAGKAPPIRHMLEFVNPSPWFQGKVGHALGGFLNKGQQNRSLHAAMTTKMLRGEKGLFKFVDNVAPNLKSVSDASISITPERLVQFPEDVVRTTADGVVIGKLTDKQQSFI
ncbi:hypothetical protein LCGC14_2298450, partial [marine sediment metagenome]